MQIGLDLRFLKNDLYSTYIINLITQLIIINKENNYLLYINKNSKKIESKLKEIKNRKNVEIKEVKIKNFSIREQTSFFKILKKDKNNLMIFFNHFKPVLYKGEYYIFIPSLKEIYYGDFKSSFNKFKYIFLLEKNLKNSRKILCFDDHSKNELIERFDLNEESIFLNSGYFSENNIIENDDFLKFDIKSKYGIENDYFIYSGGYGIEKNLDKLIWLFTKLDKEVDLIMFGDDVSKNIDIRNLIIKYSLQNRVKFLTPAKETEKYIIYKKSIGVIFPSLYETFPFHLGEAINYNVPIFTSNIKSIKDVLSESVNYFSPISKSSMLNNINLALEKKNFNTDYDIVKKNFYLEKAANNLLEIIK